MTKLKINDNGPILIEGDFELCDTAGVAFGLGDRKRVALCRCGHSANKPLCDGAHNREGFESTVAARDL